MKILKVVLHKFKRFLLTGVETFTYTPTAPLQLILGTNGSGKSSLMAELSPLPASHLDFSLDGYKQIEVVSNNSNYILLSTFNGVQKHSFIKDGNELNSGNTVTVQRELVKQEFGITPEIHDLLVSQSNFSLMSVNDRRVWFTKLSDVSYDYAIHIYNKLKDRSRDTSGALKLAKKRLVVETAKIINIEEKNSLETKVNGLHDLLNYLQAHRKPVEEPINELATQYSNLELVISKTSNAILSLISNNSTKYKSVADIDSKLEYFKTQKAVLEEKLNNNYSQYSEIESSLKVIKQNIAVTTESATSKINDINEEIRNTSKLLKLDISIIENPVECINALNTVYDLITGIFLELKENENKQYSRTKLEEVTIALGIKNIENKQLNTKLSNLVNEKLQQEHLKDHAKTTCPECNFTWSRGYDQLHYEQLCLNIEEIQSQLDDQAFEILDLTTAKENIESYSTIFNQFLKCVNNWPVLKPLWDLILADNTYLRAPRMIVNTIDLFRNDLQVYNKLSILNQQLAEANYIYEVATQTDIEENSRILIKANELEQVIDNIKKQTNKLDKQIQTLLNDKKTITYILELNIKLEDNTKQLEINVITHKEMLRREALNNFIQHVQIELANKEKALSEINQQYALVEDITKQIEKLTIDNEVLKVLVSELSPTDGLIAKGLLGFINNFINRMNKFIKKIWTYKLTVVPCDISTDSGVELDYKFPLIVADADPVKDVCKGSSAMREVIDLSFKITAMTYLGLSNYPLYLDEPSSTMDNEHKITSMKAIVALMEQQNFTQLFLVSHDHVQYGSLINTEVCILCANNIVLPSGSIYNKHVITT